MNNDVEGQDSNSMTRSLAPAPPDEMSFAIAFCIAALIVIGVFSLILIPGTLMFSEGIPDEFANNWGPFFGLIAAFSVAAFVAARGVLRRQGWARILGICVFLVAGWVMHSVVTWIAAGGFAFVLAFRWRRA